MSATHRLYHNHHNHHNKHTNHHNHHNKHNNHNNMVLIPRGVVWFMRFGTKPFCLGRLVLRIRSGLLFLHLLFAQRTLLNGPILLVSWLSGSPFQVVFTGLLVAWILELVVFLMWNCSSFMICGLVRGCLWRRLFLATFDQDVQFQCRLFRLLQH